MISKTHEVTVAMEFDSAHRLPHHDGKCRNIHGHRYRIEVTVCRQSGGLITSDKHENPYNGMVMDFAELKGIVRQQVVGPWDHAYLAMANDPLLCLEVQPDDSAGFATLVMGPAKIRRVNFLLPPTVEVLAGSAFDRIAWKLQGSGIRLIKVRLYETPECWADIYGS